MSVRFGSGVTSNYIPPGNVELWGSPTALGSYNVQLTVTDSTGAATTNTFFLKVSSLIAVAGLVNGTIDLAYSLRLGVIGGSGSYSVTQTGGSLADGLSLNAVNFLVSGTPVENGGFFAVFEFADSASHSIQATNYYTISGGASTINIVTSNNLGSWTAGSSPTSISPHAARPATPGS